MPICSFLPLAPYLCGPCLCAQVLISEVVSGWGPERFEGFVKQQQVR